MLVALGRITQRESSKRYSDELKGKREDNEKRNKEAERENYLRLKKQYEGDKDE